MLIKNMFYRAHSGRDDARAVGESRMLPTAHPGHHQCSCKKKGAHNWISDLLIKYKSISYFDFAPVIEPLTITAVRPG